MRKISKIQRFANIQIYCLDILIELEEEKINCTDPNSLKTKNGCKCRLATKDVGFGCR